MLLEENCETWHHLLKQAIHVLGKNVVVVDMADRSIYIGNTVRVMRNVELSSVCVAHSGPPC